MTSLPHQLDRFLIRDWAGAGAFGEVLEAWDPLMRRVVALKRLKPGTDPDAMAVFRAEAELTAQLGHPGVIPVYELLEHDGRLVIVMQWVDGKTLRELIDDARDGSVPWSLGRRLAVFLQVCLTVSFTHDRGVLHRDLKPSNVMVGAYGEVVLLDWGLAGLLADSRVDLSASLYDGMVGTPGYMSPEQALGQPSRASDVWSLGALLEELVTLEPPRMNPSRDDNPPPTVNVDLWEVGLRARAHRPDQRHDSARSLADEVTAFIDGVARAERARTFLVRGKVARDRAVRARQESALLEEQLEALEKSVPTWANLEAKEPLHALLDALTHLRRREAESQAEAIAAGESGLSHDPGNADAGAFLAETYWDSLERARFARDVRSEAFFEERVRHFGSPALIERLDGNGTLIVSGAAAEVWCARIERRGLVWQECGPQRLGASPLRWALDPGSYRLEVRSAGRLPITIPVLVGPRSSTPIEAPPLLEHLEPGWCHIPTGPTQIGGDPELRTQLPAASVEVPGFLMAETPVTMAQYEGFIATLILEEAVGRVPRRESGLERTGEPYWIERDGRFLMPEVDMEGDHWDPRFPVFSISWFDAVRYAAWVTEITGVLHRLPTEVEWEKAGRGADGRSFPWGDRFDPALCKMADSRQGRQLPEPVGTFATDRSIYGVRDLAGGIREWCLDETNSNRRIVRGGSWLTSKRTCRLANRFGFEPKVCRPYIGFRLVRPDVTTRVALVEAAEPPAL